MEIYLDDLTKNIKSELEDDDLIFIEDLGQGAFGKVIHCKDKKTNEDLSVKIINKLDLNLSLIEKVKQEISILKKIEHPNIVKFYGHTETPARFYIKMEYLKNGTLKQWMKRQKKITEENSSLIIHKILSAVAYLHSNQICHRDIKPENIMLSKENDLNSIKLIDFGLSEENFINLSNNDYCGTYIYMAPEEIERKSYYISVDIWSIGIIMYMLLNDCKHPFYDEKKQESKEEYINKIKNKNSLIFINKISYMAKHLLKKLLEPNPTCRYTAANALKHPWITRNCEDEIPLTFSDILINRNNIQNAKDLIMMNIFLNHMNIIYFKKEEENNQNNNNNNLNSNENKSFNSSCNTSEEYIIYYKKKEIFKIDNDYITRCKIISKLEKEKLKYLKEKGLDVSSTEENQENKNNDDYYYDREKFINEFKLLQNSKDENDTSNSILFNSNNSLLHVSSLRKLKRLSVPSITHHKDKPVILIANIKNKSLKKKLINHSLTNIKNNKNLNNKLYDIQINSSNKEKNKNNILKPHRLNSMNSRNLIYLTTSKKHTNLNSNEKIDPFNTMTPVPSEIIPRREKFLCNSRSSLKLHHHHKGIDLIKPSSLFSVNSNRSNYNNKMVKSSSKLNNKQNSSFNSNNEKKTNASLDNQKYLSPSVFLPKINDMKHSEEKFQRTKKMIDERNECINKL